MQPLRCVSVCVYSNVFFDTQNMQIERKTWRVFLNAKWFIVCLVICWNSSILKIDGSNGFKIYLLQFWFCSAIYVSCGFYFIANREVLKWCLKSLRSKRLGLLYDSVEITIFHSIQCDNRTFRGIQSIFVFFPVWFYSITVSIRLTLMILSLTRCLFHYRAIKI